VVKHKILRIGGTGVNHSFLKLILEASMRSTRVGPYRPDAIWQRDANFQFSSTFNFNIFICFPNIRNHLSNFSYLVCISCKIFTVDGRFYLFLKAENSRRVVQSRSVCVGLVSGIHTCLVRDENRSTREKPTQVEVTHLVYTLLLHCRGSE
jgi:hypothetical protein